MEDNNQKTEVLTRIDGERIFESVRYPFTETELRTMGQQLARETQTVYDLEREKKTANAEFTSKLKTANAEAEASTLRVNNGYEMREVEVCYMMNTPRPGWKTVIRADNSTKIREDMMTPAEAQKSFFDELQSE